MNLIQHMARWGMEMTESNYTGLYIFILFLACFGCILIIKWEIKWIMKLSHKREEDKK